MEKRKRELDHIVLDIEFLLISVVQGVVLFTVAEKAADIIGRLQIEFWPYIITAFLFILIFWSQSMVHAISFIDWPPSLPHSFLYFLVSFIEVITFHKLDDPLFWYAMLTVFFIVVGLLYLIDLSLIKKRSREFAHDKKKKKLYEHITARQTMELRIIIPSALAFNIIVYFILLFSPNLFLQNHYHVIFSLLQVFFSFMLLFNTIGSFKERIKRITDAS